MTNEQKEILMGWYFNIIVTYRIDYFRGYVLSGVIEAIASKESREECIERSVSACRVARRLGVEPAMAHYSELLRELKQIAKQVPLSDSEQSAITYIFGGDWEEAIEALDKLRSEHNEQN